MTPKEKIGVILETQIQLHQLQVVIESVRPMDPKDRDFLSGVVAVKLQFVRQLTDLETLIRIDAAMVKP